MMKVGRSVRARCCSMPIIIMFAAAMLATSVAPAYKSAGADNIRNPGGPVIMRNVMQMDLKPSKSGDR